MQLAIMVAVGLSLVGLGLYWGLVNLARFLNISRPILADVLVVEGWLSDEALTLASKLFWQDNYRVIITTGPPLTRGTFLSEYKTHAALSAATLVQLGVPKHLIIPLPCPAVEQFRTYTSALAVKQWLEIHQPGLRRLNLFTMSCHARRSWYIYRRLFAAANLAVGVIATDPTGFDLQTWWTTSSGFRTVIAETIAYGYVRWISWKS
ncbi:MAG: DUF218 domain-containing protein [Leptolyngbyaceae cyanobacterium SM2_3_12]|nr:DUF218 domain-containing protein [Leptolyngbyaceae cyanobacterium SM2_3_12]